MSARLLKLELGIAAALLVVAVLWDAWRPLGLWQALRWSTSHVLFGLLAAVPPPLLMILLLESQLGARLPGVREVRQNISAVLVPLVGHVRFAEALALSCLAGLSEEVFFRGVLQREIGIGFASVIFGLLHALSLPYVLWATVVGGYLGWLAQWSGNLWLPIVTHTVVDLIGLWYIRHVIAPGAATPLNSMTR